jgi:hypothetical protein
VIKGTLRVRRDAGMDWTYLYYRASGRRQPVEALGKGPAARRSTLGIAFADERDEPQVALDLGRLTRRSKRRQARRIEVNARAQKPCPAAEEDHPGVDELLPLHARNDPDDGVIKRLLLGHERLPR